MKRKANRQSVQLTPKQLQRLRKLQDAILGNEKAELSRAARSFQAEQRATEVKLARAAELLRPDEGNTGFAGRDR
jgi:hypothetical protein